VVRVDDLFPDVPCDLCTKYCQPNTVPLPLILPGCPPWQSLGDECFVQELGVVPWDGLKMRPIRHGTRGRR
jgi:hypothetical protein